MTQKGNVTGWGMISILKSILVIVNPFICFRKTEQIDIMLHDTCDYAL